MEDEGAHAPPPCLPLTLCTVAAAAASPVVPADDARSGLCSRRVLGEGGGGGHGGSAQATTEAEDTPSAAESRTFGAARARKRSSRWVLPAPIDTSALDGYRDKGPEPAVILGAVGGCTSKPWDVASCGVAAAVSQAGITASTAGLGGTAAAVATAAAKAQASTRIAEKGGEGGGAGSCGRMPPPKSDATSAAINSGRLRVLAPGPDRAVAQLRGSHG